MAYDLLLVVNSALVRDLTDRLDGVVAQFDASQLGLYLHGSHARGEAGPRSDIDVLGLCSTDEHTRQSAQRACRDALEIAGLGGDRLDLKIIDSELFAADPWVDLRRAQWLAGFPWHEELPVRTRDQAGRESLLVLAVLFEDDAFAQREPAQLRKPVGRLLSVLAGLVCATVPQSAGEARRLLGSDSRLTRELGELLDDLSQLPDDAPVTPELSGRVQQAAVDVAAVLRVHVERGILGPICTAAAEHALSAFADSCKRSA
ncbi:MAG: nucleotidyltransferase domain-containing protein [Microlunatus sp.]|nr:nucleotidyltransferase domain-containing protein [Microlunatus sp.]